MPQFNSADLVSVTIDSVIYKIPRGNYSLKEIAALIAQQQAAGPDTMLKYASLTLVSGLPAQPSSVGPNGSFPFYGGEVLTSTIGS